MQNIISTNKQSYNQIAKEFSASRVYVWPDIEILFKYVKKGDLVLDAGCGNGRILEKLKEKEIDYIGIDFSEGLISEAKWKFPEHDFRIMDLTDELRFNKKFDVVFLISVLNHFPKNMHEKILMNIKKVLKPGGYLLMINWNLWQLGAKKSVWRSQKQDHFQEVITRWGSGDKKVSLFYYAFTTKQIKNLLKITDYKKIRNFYSLDGKKTNRLKAKNIVTIAKNYHPDLMRKKSPIHGYGIFACRDIKKGEEFYEIPLDDLRYENYKRYAYIGNDQYVNDEKVLNWVNHSCNPNTILDIDRVAPVLIARTDIRAGSEITCNYNGTEVSGVYRNCNCGSPACTGKFGKRGLLKKFKKVIKYKGGSHVI